MKKIFLILILFSSTANLKAQTMVQSFDNPDFQHFFTTKLKVALNGQPEYDDAIKKAVETYWTVTPFEFCDYKPLFEKKSTVWKDDSYCYLLPLSWIYSSSDLNFYASGLPEIGKPLWNTTGFNVWLSIVPAGGKYISSAFSLNQYSNICYAPLDSHGNEAMVMNMSYRLGLIIKSMNDAILLVKEKQIKAAPLNVIPKVYDEFNKKAPAIKGKILLVNENIVKNQNFNKKFTIKEDVLKGYAGEYKIVSQQVIADAIASKDAKYAFLCPAICENKEWFVYDLASMDLVFAFHKNSGTTIDASDIKLLNEAVNK